MIQHHTTPCRITRNDTAVSIIIPYHMSYVCSAPGVCAQGWHATSLSPFPATFCPRPSSPSVGIQLGCTSFPRRTSCRTEPEQHNISKQKASAESDTRSSGNDVPCVSHQHTNTDDSLGATELSFPTSTQHTGHKKKRTAPQHHTCGTQHQYIEYTRGIILVQHSRISNKQHTHQRYKPRQNRFARTNTKAQHPRKPDSDTHLHQVVHSLPLGGEFLRHMFAQRCRRRVPTGRRVDLCQPVALRLSSDRLDVSAVYSCHLWGEKGLPSACND